MEPTIRRVLPIHQDITYWFCFTGAETEIQKIKDDIKIKREKNINRRGQRHFVKVWQLSDPPSFSLPTTFNYICWNKCNVRSHDWLFRTMWLIFSMYKTLKNNINSLAKAILYTYIINNISGIPMCEICTEKSCTVENIHDSALDVCIVFL